MGETGEFKLNGVEIVEEDQSLEWSVEAMESRLMQKFDNIQPRISEIHMDSIECTSATLNELLYFTV